MFENKKIVELPNFTGIDTQLGLSFVAKNKELYLTLLNNFYHNYKDLQICELEAKELQLIMHTIKGLSFTLGINSLGIIAEKIEKQQESTLYSTFQEELSKILKELKESGIINVSFDNKGIKITDEKKEELFVQLKQSVNSRRIQKCRLVMEEIERYRLDTVSEEIFNRVKLLIQKYNFKDAIKVLG